MLRAVFGFCIGIVAASLAPAVQADPQILYRYQHVVLIDSQWGPLAQFQAGLAKALTDCGQPALSADGKFGDQTLAAMRRLAACPGYGDFAIGQGQAQDGVVTDALWSKLTASPPPAPAKRGFVIWLTHEATDYDKAEWNFNADGTPQANDRTSFLTWGPYGATIGHGGEVQAILASAADLTHRCFGGEAPALLGLVGRTSEERGAVVRAAFLDPARKALWRSGFTCFGADAAGRDAYDAYAFASSRWLKPAIDRVSALIPAGTPRTDIDYAFFADIVMHMTIGSDLMAAARTALQAAAAQKGSPLTPAERRRVLSHVFVPPNQQRDRLGRDVVYFVDGIGEASLTADERDAWQWRSRLRTSSVGLID